MFKGALTSISLCLTLERTDGTGLAVTSHDRQIGNGVDRFEPAGGLMPNSVQRGDANVPTSEFSSALDTGLLRDSDLILGRCDHARVTLKSLDWEVPGDQVELYRGLLGEVELSDGKFTADVEGRSVRLKEAVCPAISPECRASLGDKQCRVDLVPLRMRAVVLHVRGSWLDLDCAAGTDFLMGSVRFLDGPLCGLTKVIIGTDDTSVRLHEDVSSASEGTRLLLTKGCDKRSETCRTRFGNMANFRGEPHVPGTDYLMRYPGA